MPTPPPSLWGQVTTLGRAPQADAPVLYVSANRVTAVWVGSDTAGVHQDARTLTGGTITLPLPPKHPYAQRLAPAVGDNLHLLWLDAAAKYDDETRLFSAVLTPDLTVDRGPTPISDQLTLNYSLAPGDDGALWVAWSGGSLAEPAVYVQIIDGTGRPRPPQRAAANADFPALTRSDEGELALFWLGTADGQVYHARVVDGAAQSPTALTAGISLRPGDRLEAFNAARDTTHVYLFWNITRRDTGAETWFASGTLAASAWSQPARLGIDTTLTTSLETGFQTHTARAAQLGESWLSWAVPLSGQPKVLAAAAQVERSVALVYFRTGEVIGYEPVVEDVRLIGAPSLASSPDGHLYLAWAEANPLGDAALNLTTDNGLPITLP